MTNLTQYVADATRTESRIDEVVTDKNLLIGTIRALIAIGNVLDMIKKNVFYGKEIDLNLLSNWWEEADDSLWQIAETQVDQDRPNLKPVTILEGEIDTRIFHAIVGIATESTELLEALLKHIQGGDLDFVNVCEELGDLGWYQFILTDVLNKDLEDVWGRMFAKLKQRFPEKFESDLAINRNITKERQILEDNN